MCWQNNSKWQVVSLSGCAALGIINCLIEWLCALMWKSTYQHRDSRQPSAYRSLTWCFAKGGSVRGHFNGSHITWLQVSAAKLLVYWKRSGNFLLWFILPILNFYVRGKDSGSVGLFFLSRKEVCAAVDVSIKWDESQCQCLSPVNIRRYPGVRSGGGVWHRNSSLWWHLEIRT